MRLSALPSRFVLKLLFATFLLATGVLSSIFTASCTSSPPPVTTPLTVAPTSTSDGTLERTAAAVAVATSTRIASTATPAPPPEVVPPLVGSVAPDFQFKLFQGEEAIGGSGLHLSELAGQPIVLNFWARFCGPCWSEMPELQDFYEAQGDRLQLLGIDVGQFTGLGSPKDAGKLLDALGITYPAGYTDDADVVSSYRIRAMPTTIFIDANGLVFQAWTGAIDRQQLELIVADMLDKE